MISEAFVLRQDSGLGSHAVEDVYCEDVYFEHLNVYQSTFQSSWFGHVTLRLRGQSQSVLDFHFTCDAEQSMRKSGQLVF